VFAAEKFIDDVFQSCCGIASTGAEFNVESVKERIYQVIEEDEGGFWQTKNVTDALGILENMRLISGRIQPEFTNNIRLLKQVRYGNITAIGRYFGALPRVVRCGVVYVYRKKRIILSALGSLSFVYLCSRAYLGAAFLASWSEYLALAVVAVLAFLGFKRLIE
jgi:hypothetical protein